MKHFTGCTWVLQDAVDIASQLAWPKVHRLPLQTAWTWLNNLPGFFNGIGRGKAGRAVSALSYLINPKFTNSPNQFIWALLALEALYATGHEGVKAQLMDKSEVLLGPRLANKKRFTRIYDFRSRFVHGDIDFPVSYSELELDDSLNLWAEIADCESIAAAILLATIQNLVLRDKYDLQFEYKVHEE